MERDRSVIRRREGRNPASQAAPPPAVEPVAPPTSRLPPPKAKPIVTELPFKADLSELEALASMDSDELARLLEGQPQRAEIHVGSQVTGVVTRVGHDNIFIDIGGKSEGQLEREDHPHLTIGEQVKAFVIEVDEFGIRLSTKLSGAAAGAFIVEAAETGVPVEGKVTGKNSGGFEVKVGSVRAFCPISLIDRHPAEDLDSYVGNTYEFKVVSADDKIVLSRRALLDAGLSERRQNFWESAKVGDTHQGIISSIQPFGVFIDINGVEGLVPKRELSWDESVDVASYKKGQPLQVRLVELDVDRRKITFSAKDQALSPWVRVGSEFVEGSVYPAKIVRIADYGVFAELTPGLVGLLHISRSIGKKPNIGDSVNVRLQMIDRERQRLELAAADFVAGANEAAPKQERSKGTIQQVLKNGLVVDLEDGNTGWIPAKEIDLPGNTNMSQLFRIGKSIEGRVIEHDPSRRRSVLSLRNDTEEDTAWRGRASGNQGSFGTFADLLSGFKPTR